MKKIILVASSLLITAGCATDGKFQEGAFQSNVCQPPVDVVGFTPIAIAYGDSHLVVIPLATIKPNSEIRFILVPQFKKDTDERDFANVQVSISSPADDGDSPPNWLSVGGNATDDGNMLAVCVPPMLGQDTYKYDVVVENVGQLDPRADVLK